MSVKSVIEIDVNDDKFKAFQAAFDRYQKILDQQSKKWEEVNKIFDDITKKQKNFNKAVKDSEKGLKDAVITTGNIARNMASAALSAAKWVAFGAIGGGFGLGGLASSASDYRRQALGLGISTGQLRNANVAYGRAFNAESALSNIANIQNDPANKQILARLGGQTGQNPADQLGTVYKNAIQQFKQFGQNPQFAEALGLTKIFSLEDLRRGANMTAKELEEMAQQFEKDKKIFELDDRVSKAWQDFWYALKESANVLEVKFLDSLKNLVPQLTELSKAFAKTIVDFLESEHTKKALEDFAKYLSSPEFKQDISSFFNALKDLADFMVDLLSYLPTKGANARGSAEAVKGNWWEASKTMGAGAFISAGANALTGGLVGTSAKQAYLNDLEKKYGLPQGILDSVWSAESSRGKNTNKSSAGAEGDFQFMPATAKEYGIKNIQDFSESADAASRKLKGLLRYYNNNPEKALAAYNWGEGNLNKDIQEHGTEWKKYLPAETSGYLAKNQGVIVQINNNTGGNAVATAQALPAGRN